jgi:hypothetical protein
MLVLARYWVSGVASATFPTPFFMLSTLVALARPSETPAPLLFEDASFFCSGHRQRLRKASSSARRTAALE